MESLLSVILQMLVKEFFVVLFCNILKKIIFSGFKCWKNANGNSYTLQLLIYLKHLTTNYAQ